jgi:hypothetical protein
VVLSIQLKRFEGDANDCENKQKNANSRIALTQFPTPANQKIDRK